jgi:hypothetical protein
MVRRLALFALLAGIASASPAAAEDFAGWVPAGKLGLTRSDPVATRLGNGRVLLTGGQAPVRIVAASELYDPTANSWTPAASMSEARLWPTMVTLPDGRALVAGGVQDADDIKPLFTGEVFDPRTGAWTPTGRLHAHHVRGNAVVLKDGRVLLVSASGDPRDGLLGFDPALTAEIYDPATNDWTLTGPMAAGRVAPALALLPDGRVLAAGGFGPGVGATVEIYAPASDTWTTTTPMNRPRANAGAATLPDGRILVAGGDPNLATAGWAALTSAEIFDPAAGTWTLTGSLTQQRGGDASMATLSDGRAVFVGGSTYDEPDVHGTIISRDNTLAEVFDATSGTWSATAPTLYAHSDGVAVGLLDGSLLVVGGYDGRTERLLTGSTPTPTPTATPSPTPTPTPTATSTATPTPEPDPRSGPDASPATAPSPRTDTAVGRLTFSGLPKTLASSRAGVITLKLRCGDGSACRDTLTVKHGQTTLLRRAVIVAAAKTVTLHVKLTAPTRRVLRKRAVSLTVALAAAKVKRSLTVRR